MRDGEGVDRPARKSAAGDMGVSRSSNPLSSSAAIAIGEATGGSSDIKVG
jgi:hypothetical protein